MDRIFIGVAFRNLIALLTHFNTQVVMTSPPPSAPVKETLPSNAVIYANYSINDALLLEKWEPHQMKEGITLDAVNDYINALGSMLPTGVTTPLKIMEVISDTETIEVTKISQIKNKKRYVLVPYMRPSCDLQDEVTG